MTEYSRQASGRFVSTGLAQIIQLPFTPNRVRMYNYTASNAAATANAVVEAYWNSQMGQGFALEKVYESTPALIADSVTSNGISTFEAGLSLQYGATFNISSVTKDSPAEVTTSAAHGYASGDVVILQNIYQSASTGMIQICNIPFTVTVTGATTFTIPFNTNQSNFTAYSSGGATQQATVKKVLYPYLYAPGVNVISAITTGTTTTIDTTSAHNYVVGQEIAFHIPGVWGTTQLNSLPNTIIPGSPIYGYVTAVTDYNTFVVDIDSTGYTAFNSNQTFSGTPGRTPAQVAAVGDVNSGGIILSSASNLYPSPFIRPIGTTQVSSIGGPALSGAFFSNTSRGFIIGNGAGTNQTSSVLVGANDDVIYWEAFLDDITI